MRKAETGEFQATGRKGITGMSRMQVAPGTFLAGIDAGGTGVRVRVADAAGATAFEGTRPAAEDGGPAPAIALLREANLPPASIGAGIAKFTRPGVEARWRSGIAKAFPGAHVTVAPDYEIGFWAAAESGVGVAILAGTGSVAFGRNPDGRTLRLGGRGWEWGDEGSGSHLTGALIRRTLRALDGQDEMTPLRLAACKSLSTLDAGAFVFEARSRAATDGRGFLVPLALERARAGDSEAVDLFTGAAGWLASLTGSALSQLGYSSEEAAPVYGVGGLWSAGELLTAPFEAVLRRRFPAARFHVSTASPLDGALRMARLGNAALPEAGNVAGGDLV